MIHCNNCGHVNPAEASQCEACFETLPSMTSCPTCQASVPEDAFFCSQCGASMPRGVASHANAPESSTPNLAPPPISDSFSGLPPTDVVGTPSGESSALPPTNVVSNNSPSSDLPPTNVVTPGLQASSDLPPTNVVTPGIPAFQDLPPTNVVPPSSPPPIDLPPTNVTPPVGPGAYDLPPTNVTPPVGPGAYDLPPTNVTPPVGPGAYDLPPTNVVPPAPGNYDLPPTDVVYPPGVPANPIPSPNPPSNPVPETIPPTPPVIPPPVEAFTPVQPNNEAFEEDSTPTFVVSPGEDTTEVIEEPSQNLTPDPFTPPPATPKKTPLPPTIPPSIPANYDIDFSQPPASPSPLEDPLASPPIAPSETSPETPGVSADLGTNDLGTNDLGTNEPTESSSVSTDPFSSPPALEDVSASSAPPITGESITDIGPNLSNPASDSVEAKVTPTFESGFPPETTMQGIPIPTPNVQSGATVIQLPSARLLHIRTHTNLDVPKGKTLLIGKPHEDKMPDLDVSGFADSDVVSRKHACIHVETDGYYLEDMGSSNGSYLNDEPITPGDRVQIHVGDRISLGRENKVEFIFQMG